MAAVTDSLLIVTEGAEIPKIIGSKWTNSKTVTMTSDTHITVYDQGNVWTRPSLTYINLSDPLSPQNCHNICNKHWSLSGQVVAAALSPKREFCLLQGASNLVWIVRAAEVGNEVAKGRNLKLPYPVRLVRWLDDIHAAFVTSRYVFHLDNTGITTWDCQTTTEYTEQRVVTDYQQNRLKTWSFVAAVEHAATQSTGTIEVFAMKFDASGTMSGFAAAFMPSPAIKKATTQEVLVADATMDNIIVRYVQLTVTKPSAVKILVHASLEVTSPSTAGGGIQRDFPIGVKARVLQA
ncbi:uncharacterized protein LOC129601796 [Paramacrobiotus metropolitanus]|uniref:uncharacterized protein LOC129601796 n=1 Tax=Paramacrobiotus metropolitanus TaxID=2943436 RepID=UPI0024456716|nr:uncharacterized protein LOC129601796 [Paramacrobiotus metropolitanus]